MNILKVSAEIFDERVTLESGIIVCSFGLGTFLVKLTLTQTQKESRKGPPAQRRSYSALVCLRDRRWREGAVARQTDVTGRLRNDFRNRLSCRSEEKFGNFLGLICWSVSIEMLRGLLSQGARTKEGRERERRSGTAGVDPSTTNAGRSHELYKQTLYRSLIWHLLLRDTPPWCRQEARRESGS